MSLLKKEDLKQCMDTFLKPFMYTIYSEIYPYIWVNCFYNIILIFIFHHNAAKYSKRQLIAARKAYDFISRMGLLATKQQQKSSSAAVSVISNSLEPTLSTLKTSTDLLLHTSLGTVLTRLQPQEKTTLFPFTNQSNKNCK
jgi:hypothetical protein